ASCARGRCAPRAARAPEACRGAAGCRSRSSTGPASAVFDLGGQIHARGDRTNKLLERRLSGSEACQLLRGRTALRARLKHPQEGGEKRSQVGEKVVRLEERVELPI